MQRLIILEALKRSSNHPTVEDTYTEIRSIYPTISKNTVYRNLRQLAENGEIRKVSLPGEQERYDRLTEHHYHFQCKICGLISDVRVGYLEGIDEIAEQECGFQIDEHDIVFGGICPQCRGICKKNIRG